MKRYTTFIGVSLAALALASAAHAQSPAATPPSPTDRSLQPPLTPPAPTPADAAQSPPTVTSAADPPAVELVRQVARRRGGRADALAQIIQMSAGFDDAAAAAMLDELAAAHVAAGDLNLAAEARQMLVAQHPTQPLAQQATLWLVRTYASSEIAHARRRRSHGVENIKRQLSPAMQAALRVGDAPDADAPAPGSAPPASDAGALYAYQFAGQAAAQRPALADDLPFVFARSVAARRAGQQRPAAALLTPLKHRAAGDPWGDCARAESWLQEADRGPAPKPTAHCTLAAAPPHLDGVLDDACWSGEPTPLCPGADVRFAHDDQCLYVAVCCTKLAGVAYPRDERPRPHDGDVHACDRVRLALDLDRDYATWFELTVDSRGWTADRCAGDASWNPRWYVAAAEDRATAGPAWIAEAAVPLAELTDHRLPSGAAWACSATRLPPASGAAPPADPAPQDFGLLLFP